MFKKVEIYLHTKFRRDSSIHSWDITTSGFGKRKAAILEFYFRFRFRSMYSHRHTILHLPAKFHSNRMNVGGVMTSYPFFSRWQPAAILDLIWVMLDHPRSAIVGISSLLKFSLDPMYSFGDIAIFIFCRFGLKLPIHAHFFLGGGGVWLAYFTQMMSPTVLTPKRHFLTWKHVVWAIKRENRFSGSTWARSREKKDRTGQDRTSQAAQSRCSVVRPMQKSTGKVGNSTPAPSKTPEPIVT